MFNIKTAVTAVATVTVAATATAGYVARIRKNAEPEKTVVQPCLAPEAMDLFDLYLARSAAFGEAQRISSERMMAGRYDEMSDDDVRAEFEIILANLIVK